MSPPRIVSLLPGATDMVTALGLGPALVAISHSCDVPGDLQFLPRVTRSRTSGATSRAIDTEVREMARTGLPVFELDAATILALRPTIILTQGLCDVCAISEGDVRDLAAGCGARVVSLTASTLEEVWTEIALVGAAIGATRAAADWIAGARGRLRSIHELLKAAKAPRPRMAFLEWTDPTYAAGHWVPEMIRTAGGVDVLGRPGAKSVVVTDSELSAAAPDLLVIAPCGFDLRGGISEAETFLERDGGRWRPDLPVWAFDGHAFTSRPGPRLCDGTETLARIMHPSLLGPPPSERAIQLRG